MTNWKTAEYGTPLCPVPHTHWDWSEADERSSDTKRCDEEVTLVVALNVPIEISTHVDMKSASAEAICSQWRVECARGHVLALSDGEEDAEDFDWDTVFSRG
jgi:hypothetical protein